MGRRDRRKNINELRQGRRHAYEAVVHQHYRSIYRLMAYLTHDTSLAEELTQETFASAWANIGSFRGRASIGTWLHRIAYRKFIDATRSLQRDAALIDSLREEKNDAKKAANPLHKLTDDEDLRLLYEAIRRLNPSEYIVIVLHYIQGLSFRQLAKVLDQPVGTVKWQTSQALKKMKASLTGRV